MTAITEACFFCGCVHPSQPAIPSKDNLTIAQKKISTDLLQLMDIIHLPSGITRDVLDQQMEEDHRLICVDEKGIKTNEQPNSHTLVYVYIEIRENVDLSPLKTNVWNITDTGFTGNLVVAWGDTSNLINPASPDSVQSMTCTTSTGQMTKNFQIPVKISLNEREQ